MAALDTPSTVRARLERDGPRDQECVFRPPGTDSPHRTGFMLSVKTERRAVVVFTPELRSIDEAAPRRGNAHPFPDGPRLFLDKDRKSARGVMRAGRTKPAVDASVQTRLAAARRAVLACGIRASSRSRPLGDGIDTTDRHRDRFMTTTHARRRQGNHRILAARAN